MDSASPENVPREMSEEEIHNAISDFATAAKNAIRAGFDGVEVHGANGYLVDEFLQDVTSQRNDTWGGSVRNRARFAIEVAKALVDAVGPDRVGFRLRPWNTWQGMRMADPIPQFSYVTGQLKQFNLAYLHSNPDLPYRIKEGLPLTKYDRETFYIAMGEEGYADYPFSPGYPGMKN